MIFVFLAFAGFESSAPLAEEAHNPRRTVPRAILLATVLIGALDEAAMAIATADDPKRARREIRQVLRLLIDGMLERP